MPVCSGAKGYFWPVATSFPEVVRLGLFGRAYTGSLPPNRYGGPRGGRSGVSGLMGKVWEETLLYGGEDQNSFTVVDFSRALGA